MRTQTKQHSAGRTRQLFSVSLLLALIPAAATAAAPPHPAAGAAWLGKAAVEASRPVDFNREVLPILSENCFACHGMDRNKRMAGLRLDTPEALKPLPSGQTA